MSKKQILFGLIAVLVVILGLYRGGDKMGATEDIFSRKSSIEKYLSTTDVRLLNNSDSHFFRRRQVFSRLIRDPYQSLTPDTKLLIVRDINRQLGPDSLFRCDAEIVKADSLNQKIRQSGAKDDLARQLKKSIETVVTLCQRTIEKRKELENPTDLLDNYAPLIGNLYRDIFIREPEVIQNDQLELLVLKLVHSELQKQYRSTKTRLGPRDEKDWVDRRLSNYEEDLKKVKSRIDRLENEE
jgi:hypothetical protein